MNTGDGITEFIIALGLSVAAANLAVIFTPPLHGSLIPAGSANAVIVAPAVFILTLTVIKLYQAGKGRSWRNILLNLLAYSLAGVLIFLFSYYVGWIAGVVTLLICLLVRYFAKEYMKQ